jgi:small subunit ribosomal protein S20
MASLTAAFGTLSLGRPCRTPVTASASRLGSSPALRGCQLLQAPRRQCSVARAAFTVVAKQNATQRIRLSEKERMYNKARKSAVATRMKKVFAAIAGLRTDISQVQEDAVQPVETLISEAYQEIDKAISKGVLKKNTGGRRKARLAHAKRQLLIDAGLYTPATA